MDKPMVECQGVWLRKRGPHGIEVLVEVGGTWRLAISETWPRDGQGEISYIAEPRGIIEAPHDPVTSASGRVEEARAKAWGRLVQMGEDPNAPAGIEPS